MRNFFRRLKREWFKMTNPFFQKQRIRLSIWITPFHHDKWHHVRHLSKRTYVLGDIGKEEKFNEQIYSMFKALLEKQNIIYSYEIQSLSKKHMRCEILYMNKKFIINP